MRGWNGTSKTFPLKEAPVYDQDSVDLRVDRSISEFNSKFNEKMMCNVVPGLTLLSYKNGVYTVITDPTKGLTIKDRLTIVGAKDRMTNVNSCIRISSNYLLATAHFYMMAIGLKSEIDIRLMSHIA
jgi:hypothetical protein